MKAPATFKHGIHPDDHKYLTKDREIERIPFSKNYLLPLQQHIGKPSIPVVKKGEYVKRGQLIAKADGFVSVALHAPVDGTIEKIERFKGPKGVEQEAISITTDLYSSQHIQTTPPPAYSELTFAEFIEHIQNAGIVGLGGAAFPSHVKFSIPKDKKCTVFMLNGCECEPYLTSDHRLMLEYAEETLEGMMILNHFLQAEQLYVAVEDNKPESIQKLIEVKNQKGYPIQIVPLKTKYPQGAEKMMITAILGQELPSGKLPIDLGVIVSNVGTSVAISQYFRSGTPLIERIVTITGESLIKPSNLLIPIGTPLREVIQYCGGEESQISHLILGGPMMGNVQKSLEVPVIKGTSGVLVKGVENVLDFQQYNCIRCGKCVEACPMFLNPAQLGTLGKKGFWEEMEEEHLFDCFECGSCSYVCPSGIPLVQTFRMAKEHLRRVKQKNSTPK